MDCSEVNDPYEMVKGELHGTHRIYVLEPSSSFSGDSRLVERPFLWEEA